MTKLPAGATRCLNPTLCGVKAYHEAGTAARCQNVTPARTATFAPTLVPAVTTDTLGDALRGGQYITLDCDEHGDYPSTVLDTLELYQDDLSGMVFATGTRTMNLIDGLAPYVTGTTDPHVNAARRGEIDLWLTARGARATSWMRTQYRCDIGGSDTWDAVPAEFCTSADPTTPVDVVINELEDDTRSHLLAAETGPDAPAGRNMWAALAAALDAPYADREAALAAA